MPKTTPHSEVSLSRCHHWSEYRLTCEAYDQLVLRAGGSCERCGIPRAMLHVDHDHAIGWRAVRGLVCPKCNAHLRRVDAGERILDDATRTFFDNAFWKVLYPEALEQYAPEEGDQK